MLTCFCLMYACLLPFFPLVRGTCNSLTTTSSSYNTSSPALSFSHVKYSLKIDISEYVSILLVWMDIRINSWWLIYKISSIEFWVSGKPGQAEYDCSLQLVNTRCNWLWCSLGTNKYKGLFILKYLTNRDNLYMSTNIFFFFYNFLQPGPFSAEG